ncbi:Cyclic nucleotide-gated ion channel 2 [Apostasia shenzhenica]|uniref:Cyclic nucleotide-gated ion channel 2 n=1 Tax=Apostasia shenzhenica TaxID=1088818 RepID=A0A2I0A575_9ASPA|nr:Cyclic nucleotide-gated ion channel 2 [Apostasia shenzhenica]
MEPLPADGAGGGTGGGSDVLLRDLGGAWRIGVRGGGLGDGRGGGRCPHVRGRCARGARVDAGADGVRVAGIAGGGVWEARVGSEDDRRSLSPVRQGIRLRPLRHPSTPTDPLLMGVAKVDQRGGDGILDHNSTLSVRLPVLAQGLPQHLLNERNAEGHWLHLRNDLVGIRPQPHRLFHRLSCKLPSVVGGCWYVLATQRFASCLKQQCQENDNCDLMLLTCKIGSARGRNLQVCLDGDGRFPYGIYDSAIPVVSSSSLAVKILYPIFWGLMTLSTFGNCLEPTSQWLEVIFSIITVLSGLMLFTLLIGNIQVFLHVVMARKKKMQLRCRDIEWWMRRRQLPSRLRQRVRQYERQRWQATRGEEEMDIIQDLPEGLRRDIKRNLCLELVKKVIREGDPVQRMIFIVHGCLQSSQHLSKGTVATCMVGPGSFLGDELLSWCLRRPFVDRLPPSSATFKCSEPTEAFSLDAHHLKYITEHFRYRFANERLTRIARYYSSNWRTWAAVNIQLAWRRYRKRRMGDGEFNGDHDRRLRLYAAMFMSIRPHDHLE